MRWWWGPLCSRATLWSWILIVLGHWNNSLPVDMSPHSDTLFWFRANQTLLFPLNAACSGEVTNTSFLVFGLTQPGLEPTTYHTRGEHVNYYATDAVYYGLLTDIWQTKWYQVLSMLQKQVKSLHTFIFLTSSTSKPSRLKDSVDPGSNLSLSVRSKNSFPVCLFLGPQIST